MMDKFRQTVDEYNMLPMGCSVVAGVSGGADSTLLLYFLVRLARERNISVLAAHVNHGLRGKEAMRDEQFVRDLCARLEVPLRVRRLDIRQEARRLGLGEEECGRKARYAFFTELAASSGARIATAHTATDNVETILMNLARGAGARGLCGIPPVRGGVIRPLLFYTRQEVEAGCAQYGLAYVTDSSNLTADYTRNRIRQQALPALRGANPSLERAVSRMAHALREDEELLTKLARQALERAHTSAGYQAEQLRALPNPIRRRALREAAIEAGNVRPEAVHLQLIDRLLEEGHGTVCLTGGLRARVSQGYLRVFAANTEEKQWESPFRPTKILTEPGRAFIIELIPREEYENRQKFNKLLFYQAVDYATITDSTVLRNRRAGDRFCGAGRGVTKTLKKLLNEAKLPAERRDNLAMVADQGEILWLEQFGPSEAAAVKEGTRQVVLILPEECNNDQ